MKTPLHILLTALMLASLTSLQAATVTGRSALTTAAGTEKVPIDDSGTDKYITITNIWKGMVLSGGLTASGSTAFDFSGSTGAFKTSTGINTFGGSSNLFSNAITPSANNGAALGSGALSWSNVFLASGGTLNWSNGNVVLTHSTGILTLGTGELRITTPGTNAASVPTLGSTSTLTNKTLTSVVLGTGLTASGSASNDFSGSTGTFKTSTGANTLGGAVAVDAATTPSITLNSGKTNTGFLLINGKTSGSTKFITADATAQAVVINTAAQTTGGCTLTIPDQGGVSSSFVFTTLAQTLTNKTLTAPVINGATAASGNFDLSGSSGTFKSNTGANTLGGAVSINDATTPSLTTASGKTNTGFVLVNGKTSGGIKILPADTSGYAITITNSTQTVGTTSLTIPDFANVSDTFAFIGLAQTLTNKTLTAPVINGATAASGNFDLSGSSGTFKSNTGANTLGGAVTINDATTPSLTTAASKTNTGFVQVNGKTSGALKITAADATAQTVTLTTAAQTTGAATVTIPDQAGVSSKMSTCSTATLTAGATPAFAPGAAISTYLLTPGEDETIAATTTGAVAGKTYHIRILTSGTSSRTLTFGSNFKSTGTLATGTSDAKTFVISFVFDGTNFCEVSRTTAM